MNFSHNQTTTEKATVIPTQKNSYHTESMTLINGILLLIELGLYQFRYPFHKSCFYENEFEKNRSLKLCLHLLTPSRSRACLRQSLHSVSRDGQNGSGANSTSQTVRYHWHDVKLSVTVLEGVNRALNKCSVNCRTTVTRQVPGSYPAGAVVHTSTRGGAAVGGGAHRTAHSTTGRQVHPERLQPGHSHQNQHPLPPAEGQSRFWCSRIHAFRI